MTKFDLRHFLSRLYLMISFLLYGAGCFAGIDPTSGTYNFGVVTRGDATFWSGDTHSPVFVGGNLSITNAFDFSNNHAGTLTFSGDAKPAHLVVRGTINLNGNNSNGHVNGGGFLKVGTKGSLSYGKPSGNPAAVNNSGAFLQVNEPSQSESSMMVTTAVIDNKINKETLFSSFKANSDQLKACGANTSITDEYGGRFSMQLQNNRTNVVAISKAQLTNLSEFIFKNQAPSASSPLLINVDMQGGSVDFSAPIYVGSGVNLGDINALGKYVIYNFYNGGTTNNIVNILYGTPRATIYAPYSKVVKKLSSGDIEGQVIADSYIHEGGEVHYQIFDADLSCVNTVTECTGCVSKNLIYNPDFSASNATDGWIVQKSNSNVDWGVFTHNFGGSVGNKVVGQLNWNDVIGDNYVRQVITNGVIPGKEYTFTAQAANHHGNHATRKTQMWLEFLNAGGTVVSTSVKRDVITAYSNFQNITISGTIPANTTQIRIVGFSNGTALKFTNNLLVVDCYDAVNASSVNVNANCLDQSGKITVNATGGSGQYQYYIKKGTGNWSSAQASNVFDNLTSASYTIRVEDKNIDKAECKKEFNVVIGKDPIPAKPNVTNKEICVGESTTLTAGNCASGSTLKWYSNSGLTTEITNLTVNPTETKDYYAACVGTCKSEASKLTITVKPRLTVSVDSKTICEGESATLTATNCTGNVTWNTGATGVTLTVNPVGTLTYTATCSKSGSCDATASGTVTVNPKPTVSVDSKTICIGESATLTATCAGGTVTWNTGATGTTLTVSPTTSTTYTATCKSSANCSATATGRVTVNEKPTVTVSNSGNITCVSGSVITASASPSNGVTYIWTVPAGVTNPGNQASFTANVPGTYSVKVKNNTTNCESETKSTVVTEDKNTPTITATGGELTCAKPSVTLSATAVTGASYVWKRGTTEVGTTREVSVSVAGTYTVTVTFANGCTSTATAVVTEDKNTPSITATGGELTCTKTSVTLSATAVTGASYVWKRGTTEVGTTREVSVSVAGTYTVTVTFANGCTSTATAVVTEDKNTPTITATGGELTCAKPSVTLSATAVTGASYVWKRGTTEVGTTREVSVSEAGTYTVTVTFANGCTSTATAVVTEDKNTPTITATGGELTCAKPSVTLSATAVTGASYVWKLGTAEVGTAREVSVSVAGTYTVTVTFANGCTSTATAVVTEDKNTPSITATGGELTCTKTSVTLSATAVTGASYVWKRGTTEVGTTREVSVSVAGMYTVTVTFANGCTSTATAVVTEDKNTPTITATGGELTCAKPSVTLSATAVTGASYVWKRGTIEVGTTREVSVSEAGTYTVTVTFANGCTSTATAVVTEDKNTPTITATGGELTCAKPNVTLSATAVTGASYVWKLGTAEVGTTREVSVSVAGTYTVTVTFANGCTSTATAVVTEDKNTPTITATGGELTCAKPNVTLSATAVTGASYVWKRGTTEVGTTREVSVSVAGTYTVTVTFANGCTSTATAVVTEDKNTPTITATGGELTCAKPSVTLSATAVTGASYVWKRGTTEVGTTREVSVSVAGTYTVTVTFANGCTSTATAVVTEDKNTPSITATGGELTCTKTSVTLSATAVTGASYVWKRGTTEVGTTREVSVSVAGTYTVTVTFANGCTSTVTAVVTEDKNTPTITATGGELTCAKPSVTLSATAVTGASYVWKLGTTEVGTTREVSVSADGTYSVTVTFSNGCSTSATTVVTKDTEVPTVIVEAGKLTCINKKVTIAAAATGEGTLIYKWTVPAGVTDPGNVASFETETPGVYSVEVTSENGCKVTDQIEVIEDLTAPVVEVKDKVIACDLTEVTLVAEATGAVSYSWTGPAGFTSTSREITVSTVGTYTVTVTSLVNGCTATAQGVVTKQPNPAPPQSGPHKVCFGEEITLAAICATGTAKWFSDADLTQQVTDLTFVPEETHTYYAVCGLEDCFSEPTQSVVTVIPDFPAPVLSANPEEVIQGKSSTLSGTCQTGTLVWYKDEALTEVLGTVATLVVTPPATTTYYAACEVEDCKKTSEIIVKVKDQIFDLALRKTIKGGAKNPVVYPGGSITFEIEIFNQGNVGASNIEVTDYIPEGLILSDAAWSMNGTDKAVLTIDTLAPQASVVKEITFTIASDFRGKAINAAEISDAEGGEDIDSTPDDDPTNDGTPKDDEIDEDGKSGGDEDDHDIEEITVEDKPVFDLALRKTIKGGAKNPIMKIGQEVTFVITVFNQGNVEAKNIEVVDYIPSGLTLVDTLNWNVVGNKAYLKTPIASLASSASQTIEVKFRINQSASGEVINFAEISSAENDQNLEDIDSTPDDDPSNDGVSKDDVINENGKEGGDEDDHDMEKIQICPDSKCLTAKVRVNKGV